MALSYNSVQKAYHVFHELGVKNIPSWPDDMQGMTDDEQTYPREDTVYGYDHKSDGGWENLFFFIKDPTPEFIQKWDELKSKVPNSPFSNHYYEKNPELSIFGWF